MVSSTLTAFGTILAVGVEIIGHRGASHDAPENTLASVKLAWQQDADAVEIDVYLSRDRRVVVIHDEDTQRLAGKVGVVARQTLAELKQLDVGRWKGPQWAGERIPTLEEALVTVPKDSADGRLRRLFVEVKCGAEIVPELKSVLPKAKLSPRQVVVIGFSLPAMRAVKREIPDVSVCLVAELTRVETSNVWRPSIDTLIRQARTANLDGLDLNNCEAVDKALVEKVKHAGLDVYIWTVNSAADAQRLMAAGVDGITTDRPGWLREQLNLNSPNSDGR